MSYAVYVMKAEWKWTKSSKKRSFHGQADRKGRGGDQPLLVLAVSKCENFDPFFYLKFDSLILNTHFISSWRDSKMHFSCPLRLFWYRHILTFMGPSEKDYLWQSYWIKIMKRLPAHKMTAILTTSLMSWSQKMNAVFVFFISTEGARRLLTTYDNHPSNPIPSIHI